MKIFMDNKNKVAIHNRRFHRGEVSYQLKLNRFADMVCNTSLALYIVSYLSLSYVKLHK